MSQPIPFLKLKAFLVGLGCHFHAAPNDYVGFRHSASGALVILRFYKDDETVSPTDLAITRRILDEWGVLPRAEFDDTLREWPLAG